MSLRSYILVPYIFVAASSVCSMDVLYPFYVFPGDTWRQMASLAESNKKISFTLVLNVNNGPGSGPSALYAAGIQKLSSVSNIRLLGYVDTKYGNCFNWAKATAYCASSKGAIKVSDVRKQMKNWVTYYGRKNIKGFFFDHFLPYKGSAGKASVSINSVLKDYLDIYKYAKTNFPSCMVVGNAGLLVRSFRSLNYKVADGIAVSQAARSILANIADKTQASLAFIPQGYSRVLIIDKLVIPPSNAKKQIKDLVSLARSWGVKYFVALRQYSDYPSDVLPFLIQLLNPK